MNDRLDRDTAARVLARAQELETDDSTDPDRIEATALIEAASEVGIDPNAVRDSLAIERFTVDRPDRHRLDRLSGPATIVIEREVPITVTATLDGMEAWLTSVHRLICSRQSGSLRARRRTDTPARIGRTFAGWRGDGRLGAVGPLEIEAVPQVVGSTPVQARTLVRIRVDRHDARTIRLAGGGTVGAAGVGVGVAAASVGTAMAPIAAVPLLVGGYVVARSGRNQADRLELELERLVTLVARGDRPTGLLSRSLRRARRSVG